MSKKQLEEEILPMLEEAELIFQKKDENDLRMTLVYVSDDSTQEIKEQVEKDTEHDQMAINEFNQP